MNTSPVLAYNRLRERHVARHGEPAPRRDKNQAEHWRSLIGVELHSAPQQLRAFDSLRISFCSLDSISFLVVILGALYLEMVFSSVTETNQNPFRASPGGKWSRSPQSSNYKRNVSFPFSRYHEGTLVSQLRECPSATISCRYPSTPSDADTNWSTIHLLEL